MKTVILFFVFSRVVFAGPEKLTGAECRFTYTPKLESNADFTQIYERRIVVSFLKFRDAAEDRLGEFIIGVNVLDAMDDKGDFVPNILSVAVLNAASRESVGETMYGNISSPLSHLPGDAQLSTIRPPGMGYVQFSCYPLYRSVH